MELKDFIERAKNIHGDKYDYSKVEYVNNHTKVCIICPEHGEFWIRPNNHLSNRQGCPLCKYSFLEETLHNEISEKFKTIRRSRADWLGRQELDFYLPELNIAIECQGIQHFKPIDFWGGKEKLKYIKHLDEEKYNKCLKNGIELIYYVPLDIDVDKYFSKMFNKTDEIIKYLYDTSNKA